MFMFERSREPFLLDRWSREPSSTLLLVYVRAFLTPCLCSSEVENLALLYSLFMFERSREPCATCLCSSGVENFLLDRRSREPCATLHLVYVRAFLTPCLCSSGVENPALLDSLFMFEGSREPCPTCLCSSGVENLF